MVGDFTKSEEGVKEYQKLDLQYPNHLQDELYEQWISETSADNLSKYTYPKEKEIQSIHIRLVQEEPGRGKPLAYLQYDYMHRRLDAACNVTHRYVARIGLYPIPRPHYKVTQMSFGKEERNVDYIESVDTGYSIKATKANLLKISSIGLRKEPPVVCGIVASNGITFTIANFEEMLDGMNDPAVSLLPADPRVLSTIARRKSEHGLQEAPVTASQVQQIIEQQKQEGG